MVDVIEENISEEVPAELKTLKKDMISFIDSRMSIERREPLTEQKETGEQSATVEPSMPSSQSKPKQTEGQPSKPKVGQQDLSAALPVPEAQAPSKTIEVQAMKDV